MTTELTDDQLCGIARGTKTAEPGRDGYILPVAFARAVIAADRAMQDARHREELAAYELTVANLRAAQGRDKHWHDTAWNRGHQMGMAANRDIARQATEALVKEREAHAETNRMMTEALMQAEAAQGVPDVDAVMSQAQVMASAWSLVGSCFDSGGAMQDFEEAKEELRTMLAAAPQPAAAPEPVPTSVSRAKRAQLEAHGYVVNGVAMMHLETRQRVLLDYCGFVGWYGPTPEDAP